MKKRLFSILLALCMVLCLVPTTAFAESETEETPVCTCETACTAEAMNAECSVCGAEGALAENCGKYAAEESGQTGTSKDAPAITAADVQALIDALPEAETISEDNAADVEVQLEAIDEAKVQLSDEDFAVLDFTRYDAAVAALMALSGEPDTAFVPQPANDHTHCYCGGSITAGDHASHSDVTYTAWDGTSSITYTNNTAYVYLTENATLSGHLTVDGKTLYLCLNGKTLASNGTAKIQVKNGGRLVLCDCLGGGTFKGATQSVWGGACIYLYTSTLDMFGGKLTGGKVTGNGGGGAIALDDQQCIFNMYGGEISGNNGKNYGGAIFRKFNANMPNTTGGTFNMYGGTIKDNTAKNGGAFFSTTGGTINMTGGTISGNTATMNSNNAGGGAIYMRGNGKINISGSAQITGNSSSLDGGAILMGWGTINISGSAKISNNTASRWGGAICLRQDSNQSTTLNMRGGEISGNRATKEGGAVHVLDKDCMFYLYDGKITGNTSGDGGAIYLNQEPSWLIMQGGEISGNTATGNGGGVYIYRTGSVCQLYSGKIENNKASGNGGGIYINPSNSGQLRVGNKPLVQNNTVSGKANNVYLPSGKTLTIEIGMSKGASIGVTTANTSYPVAFSNDYKKDYANYFFADDTNAHVEYKDDQKLYLVSGAVARPLTVTFDPNGGTLDEADKTKSLSTGECYGTLPVPSYAGYDFAGWYTEKDGGTEIKEDTTVTVFGTQTLYAHWTPIHVHAYTQQVQKPEALKTPADCTNNAVYYLSCACGEVSTNDADTFTAANTALNHDWGAWTQNSDKKTHTRICKRDTSHTETENCHGGTADCTHKAVCTVCGGEYGEMAAHSFTAEKAEAKYLKSAATCTEKAVYYKSCAACGLSSKGAADEATFFSGNALDHDWGAWTQNSDEKTHTRICKRDTSHTETENCHGGTADCTHKAVCTVCGGEYGEMAAHSFTAEKAEAKYLKSAATCTEKAVYYKSCAACGLSSKGAADEATFFSGNALDHDWGAWTQNSDEKTHTRICKRDTSHTETENCHGGTATCTAKAVCTVCGGEYGEMAAHSFTAEKAEAQYLKSAATCTEKAIYYKSCAVCGLSSEGTADEATFFSGNALDHNWGAWTSNEDGTHTRTCTVGGCSAGTQTENCIDANKDHKCDICDYIISECADDNKDHKCDYCGKKLTEHTGGKATCKDKAKCEVCGVEYGELDPKNHTNLKHFPAKAATKTTEGNIEYWYCDGCGKYFSDKDGTKEIKKADTVTAKLKDDSKSPQTGDTSNLALWIALLFVSGGAAIGTTIVIRKKKYNK
nr:InlB B-repeat-containing protein [Eubacterium ramulus]